jgi:2,5-diamino-6-(ribosylamino)-4(3H)-pyrimidinone 5'-phosphate reductase
VGVDEGRRDYPLEVRVDLLSPDLRDDTLSKKEVALEGLKLLAEEDRSGEDDLVVLLVHRKSIRAGKYLAFRTKPGIIMERPKVIINSAMSADGKISSFEKRQVRISGQKDMDRVKLLRAENDAVMVGVGTILADDPGLRVKSQDLRRMRSDRGLPEDPFRVVVDSRARTPPTAEVLGEGCILAVSGAASEERLDILREKCEIVVAGEDRVDLKELLSILHKKGVKRLMVEGGATLNWSLVEAGLVDEISVYVGPMIIGGGGAPTLVDGPGFSGDYPKLELISVDLIDGGILLRWRVLS